MFHEQVDVVNVDVVLAVGTYLALVDLGDNHFREAGEPGLVPGRVTEAAKPTFIGTRNQDHEYVNGLGATKCLYAGDAGCV